MHHRLKILGSILMGSILAATLAAPSAAYTRPGHTELVGYQATAMYGASISLDGRYVAYAGDYDDAALGDSNGISDVFMRDRLSGDATIVSVGVSGVSALPTRCLNDSNVAVGVGSAGQAISGNGRFVAFESCAANLVPGDTNLARDVFVWDSRSGVTVRANLGSEDVETNAGSNSVHASMNDNGRFVAYSSTAGNLATGDDKSLNYNIFRRDLRMNKTELVSVAPDGVAEGDGNSNFVSLNPSGRLLVFDSGSSNLVPGQLTPSGFTRVFLRDMLEGKTELITPSDPGFGSAGDIAYGQGGMISANGRFVTFSSTVADLVPNDGNRMGDAFVLDRESGRIERVTVTSSGGESPSGGYYPSISSDGSVIAFMSTFNASLSPWNLFIHERASGALDQLDLRPDGTPPQEHFQGCMGYSPGLDLSRDGRYIAFESCTTDLAPNWIFPGEASAGTFVRDNGIDLGVGAAWGDGRWSGIPLVAGDEAVDVGRALTRQGANLIEASVVYRPEYEDLLVREVLEDMPSVGGTPLIGNPGILYGAEFTKRPTRYQVRIQRVPGDSFDNAGGASFGLFKSEGDSSPWTQVATLQGGYGTTGKEVVFSIPVSVIGADNGVELSNLRVFTSVGSFATGPITILDIAEPK